MTTEITTESQEITPESHQNHSRVTSESPQNHAESLQSRIANHAESFQSRIADITLYIGIYKILVIQWFKKHGGNIAGGIFLILLLLGIGYTVKTYVIPVLPWVWSSSGSLLSWLWVSSWSVLSYIWSGFWSILSYLWFGLWSILSWLWSVSLWILLVIAVLVVVRDFIVKHKKKQERKRIHAEQMRICRMKKAIKRANNVYQNRTKP